MKLLHDPKWCLFYDVHTMPACPDVGANFDADVFTDRIKACGVDFIVFHARCNLGMSYYNTKVGIRHPSLNYNLFGQLAEACKEKGIAISAYINVGLNHEMALLHRDWTILTPEGITYLPNRLDSFFRKMCYNTDYGEHVLEEVKEVIKGYPISGLFLDCMHKEPCVGAECIKEMKKRGIDWTNSQEIAKFTDLSQLKMAQRIADLAKELKPDLLIYCNGVEFEAQQEIGTYLEFECLPTGDWGYEDLPVYARYLRTLGKPVVNMTGRFHKSWGDFGGIRTEASLEYDCLYGLANGMRTTIGDHFHPRGDINHAVFNLIERIYTRLQKLEPWLDKATALTDVAIVAPQPGFRTVDRDAYQQSMRTVKGATRILCELKVQFDVLSEFSSWQGYKLLILPDLVLLDEISANKIRAHLDCGGAILSSGWSGLDPDKKDFIFQEWGVRFEGDDPFDPAYILIGDKLAKNMPEMPLTLYDRGTAIKPLEGSEVLAEICAPYYSRHWDGEHGFVYLPPDKNIKRAAVVIRGSVVHISHPIFTTYYNHAPVPMKQLTANLLKRLLSHPMIKVPGLPSFARVTVTNQPHRRMVHILSYVPERRGASIDMIEEPITLHNVSLEIRVDKHLPKRVYLAPTKQELPFKVEDGYIKTTIPVVLGYAMVVFEEN